MALDYGGGDGGSSQIVANWGGQSSSDLIAQAMRDYEGFTGYGGASASGNQGGIYQASFTSPEQQALNQSYGVSLADVANSYAYQSSLADFGKTGTLAVSQQADLGAVMQKLDIILGMLKPMSESSEAGGVFGLLNLIRGMR